MRRSGRAPAEPARRERRFRGSLVLAGLLHAGLAWVVHRQAPAERAVNRAERLDFFELSVVPPGTAAPAREPRLPSESEPSGPTATPPSVQGTEAKTLPAAEPDAIADVSPPPIDEPAIPGISSASPRIAGPQERLSFDALGIGSNPFLGLHDGVSGSGKPAAAPPVGPREEAPDPTRAAERRLDRSLMTGMLDHDRAVGASRAGPVVTALEEAAMLIASPVNGQAEFVATIDAQGLVAALRPVRVSSGAPDWQRVATQAMKKLAKKRVRVPAGSAGLEVRLLLSSRIQLPSGASAGATLHQTPLIEKGEAFRLSRLEPLSGSNQLPEAEAPGVGSPGTLRQAVPVTGLDYDLADLGGSSRRVVHVTIASERPL